MSADVRRLALASERAAVLPPGDEERFAGYGVMGLPFASGHVLAMRRFAASSVGPGYTSVWHRDPEGRWEFWQDQPEHQSCPRYFGPALASARQVDVVVDWPSGSVLQVEVPAVGFSWTVTLGSTFVTRAMNRVGSVVPMRAWKSPAFLGVMGRVAGAAMGAGRVGLSGSVPSGHRFVANPLHVWLVTHTQASLAGEDFGPMGPLAEQAALGDFRIPQRGVFAIGRAFFEAGPS